MNAERFRRYGDQLWDIRGPKWLQQNGVYDKFLVDVRNKDGDFYRAYVTDLVDGGLLINLDCTDCEDSIFAPFKSLREVTPGSATLTTNKKSVEILINFNKDGPDFWFPGSILEIVHLEVFCNRSYGYGLYSLAKVEVQLEDGEVIQLVINDGPYQACRRIRELKECPVVSPETFSRWLYPWPGATTFCPNPKPVFSEARFWRSFAYSWLDRMGTLFVETRHDGVIILCKGHVEDKGYHTSFLEATDDGVTVLRKVPEEDWRVQNTTVNICNPSNAPWYTSFEYAEWFREELLNGSNGIIYDMVQCVVECVIFTEQNPASGCNVRFEAIHQDLRLLVMTYLNVYDRAVLQRVNRCWKRLLSTAFVQRDLIITHLPSKWTLAKKSRYFLPTRDSVADIISIMCHSVTKNTRIVYLTGSWCTESFRGKRLRNYLYTLIVCLKFLSIKLDWIVLDDHLDLALQAFIHFQTMEKYLEQAPAQQIPDFSAVCNNLAVTNSEFVFWDREFFSPCLCPNPAGGKDSNMFIVLVPRWSFRFAHQENDNLALSLIDMLEFCCPDVDQPSVERIHGRLNQLPDDIHTSSREDSFNAALWFTLVFAMERWKLKPPRNVSDVHRILKQEDNGSAKKLLLKTLVFCVCRTDKTVARNGQ